jgi:hypothetical protein
LINASLFRGPVPSLNATAPLFGLPPETVVYTGHGGDTTIGAEAAAHGAATSEPA